MYRAVTLTPEDRDFHPFLRRDKDTDPVMGYRMTRVTFGIASAAFLAANALLCLAKENESELPLAAKAVKESFYVDDGLPFVETKQAAISLHHQLQDLFNPLTPGTFYKKCFLDILVIFRLELSQITFNPVENAFATQQLALLATSIVF